MRHRVRASRSVLATRLLLVLACATCTAVCVAALPASAAASGGSPLHIDPSSPVAKEYALPLATARGAPPESGQRGKLFGSGIERSRATVTQTTTGAARSASDPQPGSGSGLLWMLLAALVVIALGSAGGLALRRRR